MYRATLPKALNFITSNCAKNTSNFDISDYLHDHNNYPAYNGTAICNHSWRKLITFGTCDTMECTQCGAMLSNGIITKR